MSKQTACRCVAILALSLFSAQTFAQVPAQVQYATFGLGFGARALGMGGAFISIADDITAMSYNPAGLAWLIKPEFSLGMRYGSQSLKYQGFSSTHTSTDPDILYVHGPYTAAYYRFMWDYIGGVVPFTLADMPVVLGIAQSVKGSDKADYGYLHHFEEFMLPEESIVSETYDRYRVDNRGNTTVTTFSVAVRPLEFLSLGYNMNLWNGDVARHTSLRSEYYSYFPDPETEPVIRLSEGVESQNIKHGMSHDFGILIKLRYLSAGLVYKTAFQADFTTNRDSTELKGTLYWPYSYGIGASVRPFESLTLSVDYNFANWSDGRILYDDSTEDGYPEDNPCDTYQVRFGGEYVISKGSLAIPIRLGWYVNRLFWNDFQGDPVVFTGPTCGTGLALRRFIVDIAAIYNFGSYDNRWYVYSNPVPVPTRESHWEILASISFRLR